MSESRSDPGTPLWREEFAISAADERRVNRRQFGKFLTLTSLGMFVGNLWILARSLWRPPAARFPRLAVARAAEVPVGGVKLFAYPTDVEPCILIRTSDERFVAYSQKCTHLSCAVYHAAERGRLECPCHEGYFSLADGSVLQGPPPRPLPRVILEQHGEDLYAVGVDAGAASEQRRS